MAELVRFEEFELDVRRYSLRRSGRPLKLERIPMELLLLLVSRRGELVTREEIVEKLWGKDVFLDTDNSINTAIRKIRQTLRDDPEQPRFVQTVPAKGYRFIAPIIEVESPAVAVEAVLPPATPASALPAGQVVAHYRILQKIGSGGMGVVYEAEDIRLGRHVALKFLSEKVVQAKEALARFMREAQALSALHHPNICTIYEIEEHDGQPVIVMELLEGRSLKEVLRNGPLPADTLRGLGSQLADALDAAHSKGIIHRDIKPGNVVVNDRGQAKILDFGLAKFTSPHSLLAEDGDEVLTRMGVHPGTAAYMSPEQVRGEELDARSDVFSLGIVLYEAATGKKPFTGKNTVLVMNAVLKGAPAPPNELNPSLPQDIGKAINQALEKDPSMRFQSAADLGNVFRSGQETPMEGVSLMPARKSRIGWLTIVVALSVLSLLSLVWIGYHSGHTTVHSTAEWVQLTHFSDAAQEPELSPDGRMLAFVREKSLESGLPFLAKGEVYAMLLPDGQPQQLTHDDISKGMIAFSADGSRIAYTVASSWDTWVLPSLGGQASLLLPNASGLHWIDSKRVLFSEIKNGIHMGVVTAGEGRTDAHDVYLPKTSSGMAHSSRISPDQKWVLISGEMDDSGFLPCRLVPFDGSSSGRLVGPHRAQCFYAVWSPDGKWMYFAANAGRGMHIFKERFPEGSVAQITSGPTEEKGLTISPDGRSLITAVTTEERNVWVHRPDGDQPVSSDGFTDQPSFSGDGRKVFYLWRCDPPTGAFFSGELRVTELDTNNTEHILPGIEMQDYSVSSDGKLVIFTALDNGRKPHLWIAPIDRRVPPRQLSPPNAPEESQGQFGPGGEIFFVSLEQGVAALFRTRKEGGERERIPSPPVIALGDVSPDGHWLVANVANSSARASDVSVAYPLGEGSPVQLCDSRCYVAWSPDSKFLYVTPAGIGGAKAQSTYAIPLNHGEMFPHELLVPGQSLETKLNSLKGVQKIPKAIAPGPNPSVYSFLNVFHRSNLYRIPID